MAITPIGLTMISLSLESMVYGIYAVLIAAGVHLLLSHRLSPTHRTLILICVMMFCMATLQLAFQLQAKIMGPAVPKIILQVQNVVVVLLFLFGDSIFIWRVWVIWDRRYLVIIVQVMMLLASTGMGLYRVSNFGVRVETNTAIAVVSLNTTNTVISTILIVGRVLYLQSRIKRTSGSPYKKAVLLVVESGAVYTAIQLALLITLRTQSPGIGIVANLQIPLIGILPIAIMLLVHYDLSPSSNYTRERRTQNDKSTIRATPGVSAGLGSTTHPVSSFSGIKDSAAELARTEFGTGEVTKVRYGDEIELRKAYV